MNYFICNQANNIRLKKIKIKDQNKAFISEKNFTTL